MLNTFPARIDFTGVDWWAHDRLVNYNIPNPAETDISNWLIQNPQRMNIANIGLQFFGNQVTEENLLDKSQYLDLWEGTIKSSFRYNGSDVAVQVWCHPTQSTVGIEIKSDLISAGELGVFLDFPSSDTNKFDAPYVGVWNDTSNSTVTMDSTQNTASFKHTLDSNVDQVVVRWSTKASFAGPLNKTNKFVLRPSGSNILQIVADFSLADTTNKRLPTYETISAASRKWWSNYWAHGAFIDLSATQNKSASELQKRIILSQYLVAVNEASYNPPQGKFQLNRNLPLRLTLLYISLNNIND